MQELVNSSFHFTARQLSMGVRIFHYAHDHPQEIRYNEKAVIQFLFNQLTKRGFSFDAHQLDQEGRFKGDHYGNYYLPSIELDDFTELAPAQVPERVRSYLEIHFSNPILKDKEEECRRYTDTVLSALEFYVKRQKYSFELDAGKLNGSGKSHPYYSLWEHFTSFLFFGNEDQVVYLEMGFD